ncbi:MAG: OmpA family protein [uncultured Campylobacterales bacterium]|uniref:OmpA family protein n=1 Tax=uncultured Campylobacterales bacterium TaxID=352960 RepID=A0A6S6T5F1_9BACT|nr:MAG: OmpA family protein [uncultured Campylobacterales bacterium]
MSRKTKILIAFIALVILIIICTWFNTKKLTPKAIEIKENISFVINKNNNNINLNGIFSSKEQLMILKKEFDKKNMIPKNSKLSIKHDIEDSNNVFPKIAQFMPVFLDNYENGQIVYTDKNLTISGTTYNKNLPKITEQIFNPVTGLNIVNNTKVQDKTPSGIVIIKNGSNITLDGNFANQNELNSILNGKVIPGEQNIQSKYNKFTQLSQISNISNLFYQNFTKGQLSYTNNKLTVIGETNSTEAKESFVNFLNANNIDSNVDISLVNIEPVSIDSNTTSIIKIKPDTNKTVATKRLALSTKLYDIKKEQNLTQKSKKIQDELIAMAESENIEFRKSKATLTTKGKNSVVNIANILKKYPNIKIQVAGHTDSDGDASYNKWLSQLRVNNVKQELIDNKINQNRIEAVGYGETKPLFSNDNTFNKQKNRRVEFIIIGE